MQGSAHNTRELGRLVRASRRERGLSIRQCAALAGVDATWLSRLERGDYGSPHPRHLRALACALRLELTELYHAAGYQGGESLPKLEPYLRAKYDLPEDAVEQLAAHFELLANKHRIGRGDDDARRPH